MNSLFDTVSFAHGPSMPNRFMLAPLTNMQSHPDGTLSDDEKNWLVKRAEGGFGLVMTCAAHVQKRGQGFPGQLGTFSDDHGPGLTGLAQVRGRNALSWSARIDLDKEKPSRVAADYLQEAGYIE